MSYQEAKQKYAAIGVDTDAAIARLKTVPISLHCWQGDDVRGFDRNPNKPLTGGIQTTGNYPGRARTPEELMADIDVVLPLCPGTKKINLHASYAIFTEENRGSTATARAKHLRSGSTSARRAGSAPISTRPSFRHPMCDPLTLSSPNAETRDFWINHGKACPDLPVSAPRSSDQPCSMNIWTGDGLKDVPCRPQGPRDRYRASSTRFSPSRTTFIS